MQKADSGVWRQELLCGPDDSEISRLLAAKGLLMNCFAVLTTPESVTYRRQRGCWEAALRPWQLRNAPSRPFGHIEKSAFCTCRKPILVSGGRSCFAALTTPKSVTYWRQELLCGPDGSGFSYLVGGKGLLEQLLCGEFEIVAAVHPCVAAARVVEGVFYLVDGEVFVKTL